MVSIDSSTSFKPCRSVFKVSFDRDDNSTADTSGPDKTTERSRPVIVGDVLDAPAARRRRSSAGSVDADYAGGRERGPQGEGPGSGVSDPDAAGGDRSAAGEDRGAREDGRVKLVRRQLKSGKRRCLSRFGAASTRQKQICQTSIRQTSICQKYIVYCTCQWPNSPNDNSSKI